MADLDVQDLTVEFNDGEILAVNGVSFLASDGEFITIVGPSGCGKSTIMNCIAGLEEPTQGEISLDGVNVTDKRPQERDIAMVFQNYALYPHMDVSQNLAFGLKMMGEMSKTEQDEAIEEMASLLDIEELLDQKPKELSGGQQQRVALGRAIVREPEVFLMDEPLSNLDAKLRAEMRTEIQRLQNQLGVTTLYVTHDQVEAMTMGDRIIVMNDGEVQQIGTPLEIFYKPENRFVAGFVGSPSMNFFDVETDPNEDGGLNLVHEEFTYYLNGPPENLKSSPANVIMGIRPEAFEIAEDEADNTLDVEIEVVEFMGEVNYVYFSFGSETYTVSLPPDELQPEGTVLSLKLPEDQLYFFDAETGQSITNNSALKIEEENVDLDQSFAQSET